MKKCVISWNLQFSRSNLDLTCYIHICGYFFPTATNIYTFSTIQKIVAEYFIYACSLRALLWHSFIIIIFDFTSVFNRNSRAYIHTFTFMEDRSPFTLLSHVLDYYAFVISHCHRRAFKCILGGAVFQKFMRFYLTLYKKFVKLQMNGK